MEALFSGVVIAALTGITALAFKHPEAFGRLYPYLTLSTTIVFMTLTVWQAAVQLTWTVLETYLDPARYGAAQSAKADLQLPYVWVCVGYVGTLVFLWINMRLPRFISTAEERRPRNGNGAGNADG